jgi:hypothetical protein
MSKPSTGREQQQSSPFGLGHKQAKKAKKYGANAPQLRAISLRPPGEPFPTRQRRGKNTVQTRRICTIFFPRDESYRASFEMPCCSFGGRKHA